MNDEKKPGVSPVTAQNVVEGILKTPPGPEKLDPNLIQKPIRTYESDLAEALAKKQGSVASISIAESRRKEEISRATEPAPIPKYRGPSAVAPTRATAIPGVEIEIAPNVDKNITSDITDALYAANVTPTHRPAQEMPLAQQEPAPAPRVKPAPTSYATAPSVPMTKAATSTPYKIESDEPRASILKPILLSIFSIIFIAGGIFAGYVFVKRSTLNKPVVIQAPLVIPSIIPYDKQVTLTLDATLSGDALLTRMYSELNKSAVASGKILELSIKEGERPMSGSSFIKKIDTNIPDVITRSLTDRFMLGLYGEETGQKTSYLALTTDFFQNAFAGMLIWEEKALADDLALLLNFKDRARKDSLDPNSTASYFTIRGQYSDKVIRNRDVREFRSPQGELLFLYSFINKETLLVTTTESAFIALVDRIEKDSYVR